MDDPLIDYPKKNIPPDQVVAHFGWHKLVDGYPWFEGDGRYPLPAYSEFMPPPRLGRTPYGDIDPALFSAEDPYGWYVSEREEEFELKPGLLNIAHQVMNHLLKLGRGLPEPTITGHDNLNLLNNPYWPPELAAWTGKLSHERYVSFLPLVLSRTQDDKGRLLWTFFGGSEQGPERVFWKSFFTAPGQEMPEEEALAFFVRLLSNAYGEDIHQPSQLQAAGFYILPSGPDQHFAALESKDLPSWSAPFIIDESASIDHVHYLLTFRPFSRLPVLVKEAYLAGKLNLLPFPGSLVFWGMPTYLRLQEQLPQATQVALLSLVARHGGIGGVRVPQHGWIYDPRFGVTTAEFHHELLAPTHVRTSRWDRIHRFEDELSVNSRTEKTSKCCSALTLRSWAFTISPWRATARSGRASSTCCWMGRAPRKRKFIELKPLLLKVGCLLTVSCFLPCRLDCTKFAGIVWS